MKKLSKTCRRFIAAGILLILGMGLMMLSRRAPGFAEAYAVSVYPVLVAVVGRAFGWLPFSVVEMTLYLLVICLVVTCVRMLVLVIRRKTALPLFSWISGVALAACLIVFLYAAGCGVNYSRDTFSEEEDFETFEYTAEELAEVCVWLTDEVNASCDLVERDEEGLMTVGEDAGSGAAAALRQLAVTYSSLEGFYPRPKGLIVSEILSYQSLTGVYSPFTIEANYNTDMVDYNIPFVMCHELSHLRGYMEEKEANFIAFLACIGSEREDFVYSGYLSGWIYSMNALYRADHDTWSEIRAQLDEAVQADLSANSAFWDQYEGTVAEVSEQVNDTYLKANGQEEGVDGYDRMVDLIVAYYYDDRS